MRCSRLATRISKNSSRLLAVMARNLTRSRRGLVVSSASSSTRRLKSIHDSSRSKKRSAPSGTEEAVSLPAGFRVDFPPRFLPEGFAVFRFCSEAFFDELDRFMGQYANIAQPVTRQATAY